MKILLVFRDRLVARTSWSSILEYIKTHNLSFIWHTEKTIINSAWQYVVPPDNAPNQNTDLDRFSVLERYLNAL